MKSYRVEVKVNSDVTFEVNGYESEEEITKKIEGNFDVFGRSSKEFRMIDTNVGYIEVLNIEEIKG